ncbi:MAG: DUF1295 domain-containing protein [Xanthomonadales bacterium]|nr:DUF1295 domain-containing protein [Xanthomonadales bacterium]
MNPIKLLLCLWLFCALVMALGWLWQQHTRNATLVDVLWSACVGIAALSFAVCGDGALWPRIALGVAGGLWGLRLATHLGVRAHGKPEDGRYRAMREHWHRAVSLRFFLVYQFQALIVVLFALPFVAVAHNGTTHLPWLVAGAFVWLLAVGGEALADRQLRHFRCDPNHAGCTLRAGLWRYSRHPNYFFEWLHWFAYVCFAVGSPWWWLACSGPLLMYLFLRYLSGVPWSEMQALRSRGDDYRDYQRVTPMLFPWFPKQVGN